MTQKLFLISNRLIMPQASHGQGIIEPNNSHENVTHVRFKEWIPP